MKLLSILFAGILGAMSFQNPAAADEKLKVMYVGLPVTGPGVVFAQTYAKNLKMPYTFVTVKDCNEAIEYVKNNDNIIWLTGSTSVAITRKHGIECAPKYKPQEIVFISEAYWDFCHKVGVKKDILRERFTVAHSSIVPMLGIANDINRQNNMSMISIPVQSSDQAITSILNGDTDYGFIIQAVAKPMVASGKMECPLSTNPKSPNYLAKQIRSTYPNYKSIWHMMVKTSDPAIRVEATRAAQSPEFTEVLNKFSYVNTKTQNFDQSDIDRFENDVQSVLDNFLK
jgi:hypothetical protein